MNVRFPLYAKILGWVFLNLVVVGLIFYLVVRVQFRFGLDSLIAGRAGDRIQSLSEVVFRQLSDQPREEWTRLLEGFTEAYRVRFFLYRPDAVQIAGESITLPPEVRAKLLEPRGPGPRPEMRMRGRGLENPPPFSRGPPNREAVRSEVRPRGPFPKSMVRTTNPSRYWVIVRLGPLERERLVGPPTFGIGATAAGPYQLILMSESIRGAGLFFDYMPWLAVGSGVLAFSVLFWFPLMRGITRSIAQMTDATEQIAQGHFEVRVKERRRDELGLLGSAINRMAARLAGFVHGQKRFLGDIAHELCSPIARIQVALGILEQRADEKQRAYVEDVREEIHEMSNLVNELLSFTKAGLTRSGVQLRAVPLRELAERVVEREVPDRSQVVIEIDPAVRAMAEPELLGRALGNLLRNAVRYAGQAGPVKLSAELKGSQINLMVADEGPGVPEEVLEQIFDPFFRLEPSRSRETGGVGLGLAIVKSCVEACGGTVRASNRKPSGLQIDIIMNLALA